MADNYPVESPGKKSNSGCFLVATIGAIGLAISFVVQVFDEGPHSGLWFWIILIITTLICFLILLFSQNRNGKA